MIDIRRAGHATFTTPDLDRQVDYYSDMLGLIVTERGQGPGVSRHPHRA